MKRLTRGLYLAALLVNGAGIGIAAVKGEINWVSLIGAAVMLMILIAEEPAT